MRNSGEQPPGGPHDETQGVHRTGGARISELDWQCCRYRVELRSWLKRVGSAHQNPDSGLSSAQTELRHWRLAMPTRIVLAEGWKAGLALRRLCRSAAHRP